MRQYTLGVSIEADLVAAAARLGVSKEEAMRQAIELFVRASKADRIELHGTGDCAACGHPPGQSEATRVRIGRPTP